MKISFGANYRIITKNEKIRDRILDSYADSNFLINDKKRMIVPYRNNEIIILDGQESQDFIDTSKLNASAKTKYDNLKFNERLLDGYSKKSIVVDLKDTAPCDIIGNIFKNYAKKAPNNVNNILMNPKLLYNKTTEPQKRKISIEC